MKHFLIISFVTTLFACNGNNANKHHQTDSQSTIQSEVKEASTSSQDTLPDTTGNTSAKQNSTSGNQPNDQVYGIERKGSFRMYTHRPESTSKYNLYKGDPKVEILDKEGEIVKTVDIFKTQQLLPDYDSISPHPNARNMFRIHLTDSQDVYDYINTDYFGHVKPMPNLFYEIRYEVNNGVLWVQNIARGMNTNVYGGQTEIIGIDSTGHEIGRFQLKGWMASMSATEDNNYIVLKTGGQATERIEFWNPMRYYAIDVNNTKILYQNYTVEDWIGGGVTGNKLYMYLRKNRNSGNWKGLYKIKVLDPKKQLIYQLDEEILKSFPEGSPGFYENHLKWHIPNQENIKLEYENDFQHLPLRK